MLFKNKPEGAPYWTDFFQAHAVFISTSCDPDLIVFENRGMCAHKPSLILRIGDDKIKLSDLLLYVDFFPSRAAFNRALKEKSLKYKDGPEAGFGTGLTQDIEIDLTEANPWIEVRRGERFLEIAVGHREKIPSGLREELPVWIKESKEKPSSAPSQTNILPAT